MISFLFIYGTTSGNTEMVVDWLAQILEKKGHQIQVQRAELSVPQDIMKGEICVFASPTYGHGLLQDDMMGFIKKLRGDTSLRGKSCAVIGLGQFKYDMEYHVEAAPLLEKAIEELGGKLILPSLRVSGPPVPHLNTYIKAWAEQLMKKL